jgi:spore germination protein GerM
MNEQQQSRRVSTSLLVGVAALVLVAGGGVAWWAKNQPQTTLSNTTPAAIETITPPPPPPVAVEPAQPAQPAQPATTTPPATAKAIPVTTSAQVFWLTSTSTTTELVPVPVASTTKGDKQADLNEAFTTLLAGPSSPNTSSAIPQNTQLRNLTLKEDGVYIDLSKEFTSGGGSASMIARLAQVLYTATSIDANAKVWLSVDGQPLEVLGGEGLEVPQPLTRDLFKKEFAL